MNNKKRFIKIIATLLITNFIVLLITDKQDKIYYIGLITFSVQIFLIIAALIVILLKIYICNIKILNIYRSQFYYIKLLHRQRYKSFFNYDKKITDELSRVLDNLGKELILKGKRLIKANLFNNKQICEINSIIQKTQIMLNNEFVEDID